MTGPRRKRPAVRDVPPALDIDLGAGLPRARVAPAPPVLPDTPPAVEPTPIQRVRDRLALVGVSFGLTRLPWAQELANGLAMALPEHVRIVDDGAGSERPWAPEEHRTPFAVAMAAVQRRRVGFGMPLPSERVVPLATALAEEWAAMIADGTWGGGVEGAGVEGEST